MNFKDDLNDTSDEVGTFTAPVSGTYSIGNTFTYLNRIKFQIWTNKAKMRKVKLSNKNSAKLRKQCLETYIYDELIVVQDGEELRLKMNLPENVVKKMGDYNTGKCQIDRMK